MTSDAFFPASELATETVEPGRIARVLRARGGNLMLVEVAFEAGAEGAAHEHPHEQASYCLEGEFIFTIGSETRHLVAGDSVYIAPSLRHGTTCLRRGRLLDCFTPQREDFLEKLP